MATAVLATAVLATACSSGTGSGQGAGTSTSKASSGATATSGPAGAARLPAVHHVFVIVLENEGFATTFGNPTADPELARTLPSEGALLSQYYGIGHFSNDNYLAMISGQPPNPATQADCSQFVDFPPSATVGAGGILTGSGCVYPSSVRTVANQLTDAHLSWKAYMEDMGNLPSRESATCGHPALGSPDHTQTAVPGDGYATRHDPFVYFHGIIDDTGYCAAHVVPLGSASGQLPAGTPAGTTGLAADLASAATTPDLAFITPNLCNDGHDAPCVNQPASSSALVNVDAFLSTWVPRITSSPAYRDGGMLVVTFDEAESTGPGADATACCHEQPGPAAAQPGQFGPGGGRIGTVVLSRYVKPGTVSNVPYNHYSLLATIEAIFGLARLGQAATTSAVFGPDVFTAGR